MTMMTSQVATASLKQQLEKTRDEYEQELLWMRFLIDSYTGMGGYQGSVRQPSAGFWGAAAQAYQYATLSAPGLGGRIFHPDAHPSEQGSYLDRHDREDSKKYMRRVQVAHYLNYVKPTTNLKISYLVRKPHLRNNLPPELQDWIDRTGYNKHFRKRALVAALLGWFPMLVDMPRVDPQAQTRAQAGNLDPYAMLLLPCNLRDYELDEQGKFVWAKMQTIFRRQSDWNAAATNITRSTVWRRDSYTIFEQDGDGEPVLIAEGKHPFGQVPIISWRTDVSVEDHVKADSVVGDIALEGRRLFNLLSELDEHLRGQVFALLILPTSSPSPTESIDVGVNNGLVVSSEQKNMPFYLAPPPTVAATYEARIVATIIEIYRIVRVEYDRASGTESSAQSKQQNFEQTNLSIVDIATALAEADRETLVVVGRGLGISDERLQQIECIPYNSYATEDLSLELEQAVTALTITELGAQARVEILQRLAQQLLPNLAPETQAVIAQQIADAVAQIDKERAAQAAADAAAADATDPNAPPDGTDAGAGGDAQAAA